MLGFLPAGTLSVLLHGREGEIWFMLLKLGEEIHARGQELTPAHPAKMAQRHQGPSLGLGQALPSQAANLWQWKAASELSLIKIQS